MKKIALRVTICLFISISSLNLPNIGNFECPKATVQTFASTHSVKKVKKVKKKSKNKKKVNKVKSKKKK